MMVRRKWKTRLDWVIKPVLHDLVRRLRFWRIKSGKTGVTANRDKIEFRLFNSSSIFNIILREELLSSPKRYIEDRTRIKQPKTNLVTVGRDSSFP